MTQERKWEISVILRALRQRIRAADSQKTMFGVVFWRERHAKNGVRSVDGGRAKARNSFVVVTPWSPWGSNGECRRRRAVRALPRFLSRLIEK